MEMTKKVIVAHPHKQHSFQLATALEKSDLLFAYVTTVYQKEGSITAFISRFLKGNEQKKANSRRCEGIPDNKVVQFCELYGLLYLIIMRIVKNNKKIMEPLDAFIEKRFGKKLAKFAVKNEVSAVICYDTQSVTLFRELQRVAPQIKRVMDVSAANLIYLKKVYIHDMENDNRFKDRLLKERPTLFNDNAGKNEVRILEELKNTDYFLVPSIFAKESLTYSGIDSSKIYTCPYGVDLSSFSLKQYDSFSEPIKFIYVGGIKQLKGIGYLLQAFHCIDKSRATLTVVGAGNISDSDILPFINDFEFKGMVVHSDIPLLLKEHDVFVFPSLGDSFGFAPLEAAATGLPLIVSKNTGLSDYITDGFNGFIIEPHSTEALIEKINWFIEHKDEVKIMGERANKMASDFTVSNYYKRVTRIVSKILNDEKK